jgi:primosomal protein N''
VAAQEAEIRALKRAISTQQSSKPQEGPTTRASSLPKWLNTEQDLENYIEKKVKDKLSK